MAFAKTVPGTINVTSSAHATAVHFVVAVFVVTILCNYSILMRKIMWIIFYCYTSPLRFCHNITGFQAIIILNNMIPNYGLNKPSYGLCETTLLAQFYQVTETNSTKCDAGHCRAFLYFDFFVQICTTFFLKTFQNPSPR